MTLQEIYEEENFRRANVRVLIGGDELVHRGASWSFGGLAEVPTARIILSNPAPAVAAPLVPVRIYAGYDGQETPVFTGKVLNVNRSPAATVVECVGLSYELEVTYQKVLVTVDGTKSVAQLATEVLDAAGVTDYVVDVPQTWTPGLNQEQTLEFQTYAEALFKLGEAEIPGATWYELPTGQVRFEHRDMVPSSTVARQYFSGQLTGTSESQPAGVDNPAARPRLINITSQMKTREVKNRVYVRGTTVDELQPDGSTLAVDIEGVASADSPWVRKGNGAQGFNDLIFSNEIFDDAAVAARKAVELVVLHNRLLSDVTLEIPADPLLLLGTTVQVIDPDYSQLSARWFVSGYATTYDSSRFRSQALLTGGIQAGGTINANPFAQFIRSLEHEIIGDREYIVGTFDARASLDIDGSIVSYAWSDNQNPDIVSGTSPVVTVRLDPAALVGSWEVTLQVTDDRGATDAFTAFIDINVKGLHNFVGEVFVAFDTRASATKNGGVTWNDAVLSGTVSVAARPPDGLKVGYAVYGTSGGAIYRTTNYAGAVTQVLAAVGSPIEHIRWLKDGRVFAITRDGRVYRSSDDGATWALFAALTIVFGLAALRLSRILVLGTELWVCGGDTAGNPFIAYYNGAWRRVSIGGALATDAAAAADPTLYVADVAGSTPGGELALVCNSANLTTAVYYATNGKAGSFARATGAPAKSRGTWIARDLRAGRFCVGYNDNACYTGDVSGGVLTVAQAAASLDAGDAHNHGIWLGEAVDGLDGVYVVGAEGTADGTVYKTWNRFAAVAKLRPASGFPAAPAGGNAKQVAAVGRGPEIPPGGPAPNETLDTDINLANPRLLVSRRSGGDPADAKATWRGVRQDVGAEELVFWQNPWEVFTPPSTTAAKLIAAGVVPGSARVIPRALTRDDWIVFVRNDLGSPPADGVHPAWITHDAGQTWALLSTTNVVDVARAADGRFWLARGYDTGGPAGTDLIVQVMYSDNQGATWTLNRSFGGDFGGMFDGLRRAISIACHPDDSSIVGLFMDGQYVDGSGGGLNLGPGGSGSTRFTFDRGASWQPEGYGGPGLIGHAGLHKEKLWITGSGRVITIWHHPTSSAGNITYSENYGGNQVQSDWAQAFGPTEDFDSALIPAGHWGAYVAVLYTRGAGQSRPLCSADGGLTWQEATQIDSVEVATGLEGMNFTAAAFDPFQNIVSVFNPAAREVWIVGPVGVWIVGGIDPVWRDVTANFPAADNSDGGSMDFIPRPAAA